MNQKLNIIQIVKFSFCGCRVIKVKHILKMESENYSKKCCLLRASKYGHRVAQLLIFTALAFLPGTGNCQ